MVEGKYSHLTCLFRNSPQHGRKIQPKIKQGLKFRIYIELQRLNTKETKLSDNKRAGEGGRLPLHPGDALGRRGCGYLLLPPQCHGNHSRAHP